MSSKWQRDSGSFGRKEPHPYQTMGKSTYTTKQIDAGQLQHFVILLVEKV
jgi:hypothetical protein